MGVWEALGYDRTAEEVRDAFHVGCELCVLDGPPGVGKSLLARGIGAAWADGGGITILAEGDPLKGDVSFYPFGLAMSQLGGWTSMAPAIAGVARAGELFAGTGGLLTSTVELFAKAGGSRRRGSPVYLGEAEQQVLHALQRLGKKKRPTLLIADNLHWWDSKSIELLGQLTDERVRAAFPFLERLCVLGVQTREPYQQITNPEAHAALLSPIDTKVIELERVPRNGFAEVLVDLGATPRPSEEIAEAIYDFSGGHLAIASRCAARITAGEGDVFLAADDSQRFLTMVLTERFQSLGTLGVDVFNLLQVAAACGLTFRNEELMCATEAEPAQVSRLMKHCQNERLVDVDEGIGRFVHELYRDYFLTHSAADVVAIHQRLTDCLRLWRPAEYELRCANALKAEATQEAGALAVHAALMNGREGREPGEIPRATFAALEQAGLTHVLDGLLEAQRHVSRYRFTACRQTLDSLPGDLPKSLLAEADYIRAMALMSTRSEDDRARGRSVLQAWAGYERIEPEIGLRLALLRLYGLGHMLEKEPGWELEARLGQFLSERAAYDPSAIDAAYTLGRCSGGLHEADVAIVRVSEAVGHFGPQEDDTIVRRPVEYYRCLVNLGACQIGVGEFEQARDTHRDVDALLKAYPPEIFPRLDFPSLNAVVADHRAGATTPQESVARQEAIVALHAVESDPFYTRNALAVYQAFNEDFAASIELFDQLEEELVRTRAEPEPSMVYLIRANRAATKYVSGEIDEGVEDWSALNNLVTRIAYASRSTRIRRHTLFADVMAEKKPMTPTEFDQVVIQGHPDEVGPVWKHLGRGFTLPAVQFRREN